MSFICLLDFHTPKRNHVLELLFRLNFFLQHFPYCFRFLLIPFRFYVICENTQTKKTLVPWCSKKRALSDWLLAPNTKWCGRGQSATAYNQLGGSSKVDKCCRRHDNCRMNIHALTSKWELFNYRPFTISHCNCDMRLAPNESNHPHLLRSNHKIINSIMLHVQL